MRTHEIIEELTAAHPGKNIVTVPAENPTEVICQVVPASANPEVGHAAAVISGRSQPHYHEVSHETYTVSRGKGVVYLEGEPTELEAGDSMEIPPGQVHYAEAEEMWVMVESRPAWTAEDHFVVDDA